MRSLGREPSPLARRGDPSSGAPAGKSRSGRRHRGLPGHRPGPLRPREQPRGQQPVRRPGAAGRHRPGVRRGGQRPAPRWPKSGTSRRSPGSSRAWSRCPRACRAAAQEGGPLPPAGTPIPSEAVATSVTVGSDGYWYVGELRGFPATPGTSQIWKIKPGTVGATCDPENPGAALQAVQGRADLDRRPRRRLNGVYAWSCRR